MPEGDTIFRAARALHAALAGKVVTRFETVFPALARVDADAPIAGQTVERVRSAGKHVLMAFSGGLVLRTHMRMSGSWHLYRPGVAWRRPRDAMRIALEAPGVVAVAFDVPVAELLDPAALARQPDLRRMGPDLLDAAFDAAEVVRRLRARPDVEIGDALLDQAVVAGIGNEFKSEILFATGVHPARAVGSLDQDEVEAIVSTARRFLAANVVPGAGGGRRTTGRLDPRARLFVYGRGGEPCRRCGEPVVYFRQGRHARGTYACPRCQR